MITRKIDLLSSSSSSHLSCQWQRKPSNVMRQTHSQRRVVFIYIYIYMKLFVRLFLSVSYMQSPSSRTSEALIRYANNEA